MAAIVEAVLREAILRDDDPRPTAPASVRIPSKVLVWIVALLMRTPCARSWRMMPVYEVCAAPPMSCRSCALVISMPAVVMLSTTTLLKMCPETLFASLTAL